MAAFQQVTKGHLFHVPATQLLIGPLATEFRWHGLPLPILPTSVSGAAIFGSGKADKMQAPALLLLLLWLSQWEQRLRSPGSSPQPVPQLYPLECLFSWSAASLGLLLPLTPSRMCSDGNPRSRCWILLHLLLHQERKWLFLLGPGSFT